MNTNLPPLDSRLLRLDPTDNVVVAKIHLPAGTVLFIDGLEVALLRSVGEGFKIAARSIASGERIFKFGCPIGSAIQPIRAGEPVHVHNMRSDYIPTYLREGDIRYAGGH